MATHWTFRLSEVYIKATDGYDFLQTLPDSLGALYADTSANNSIVIDKYGTDIVYYTIGANGYYQINQIIALPYSSVLDIEIFANE